jgi:anti-anti-sigma factor
MSEHAPGQPDERRQAIASQYRFRAVPTIMAELQRALLPSSLPVLQRARIAARYRAAKDSEAAGGGWFDAIPLTDGTVALAVGDVAGCGVSAVAAMGKLRAVLGDQLAVRPDLTAALERADAYAQRTPELLAATMVLVQFNPADGALSYVTCGSPPPLTIGAAGGARFLGPTGTGPLGTGYDLAVRTAELRPGDFLLLCTDGLIQRPGSTVAEGMTELAVAADAVVASRPVGPGVPGRDIPAPEPDQLCRRVVELLGQGGYAADVTTLAVHVTADPVAALSLSLPAEENSVLRVRRAFSGWLAGIDVAVQGRDDLTLAVVEAVTNAVEHAYPPERRGIVEFRADLGRDGTLECQVTDHGRWRQPDLAAAHRGHGLMVAGQVVDQMLVSAQDGGDGGPGDGRGTVVTLWHRLGRAPSISTDVSLGRAGRPGIPFGFGLDSAGAVPIAIVSGGVDSGSAERLAQRLLAACRGGTLPLVIDLTGVTYLASSAVRAIYQVREMLTAHKQELAIIAPAGCAAAELLDLVRLPHESGEPGDSRPAGPC